MKREWRTVPMLQNLALGYCLVSIVFNVNWHYTQVGKFLIIFVNHLTFGLRIHGLRIENQLKLRTQGIILIIKSFTSINIGTQCDN